MRIHRLSLGLKGLFSIPDIINFQRHRGDVINAVSLTGFLCMIVYSLAGGRYNVEDSVTLILLSSAVLFIIGIVFSNQYVTLTDETEDLSEAKEGSYVHASGEIAKSNGMFPAPFTDDEGPIIAWKIEEEKDNFGRNEYVDTISEGIVSNKFQIEDDDGTVTVDFEDGSSKYNIHSIFNKFNENERVHTVTVEPEQKPPQRIEDFINGKTDVSKVITNGRTLDLDINYKDGRRRYKQYVFKEGDEIYVRGMYKKDGFEDIIRDADEGTYVIGDSKDNYMEEISTFIHWSVASSLSSAIIGISSVISINVAVVISLVLTAIGIVIGLKWLLGMAKEASLP